MPDSALCAGSSALAATSGACCSDSPGPEILIPLSLTSSWFCCIFIVSWPSRTSLSAEKFLQSPRRLESSRAGWPKLSCEGCEWECLTPITEESGDLERSGFWDDAAPSIARGFGLSPELRRWLIDTDSESLCLRGLPGLGWSGDAPCFCWPCKIAETSREPSSAMEAEDVVVASSLPLCLLTPRSASPAGDWAFSSLLPAAPGFPALCKVPRDWLLLI
mmetsp:Transcript_595/g.2368  ORF Transcript_595/g.2368 Transcript_595/m.2368 type:complete len:219 (+) Transcript_595:2384-3040(+)